MRFRLGPTAIAVMVSATCMAQSRAYDPSWNQPARPHKVIDNIYFVGTNELGSFLVTTGSGHILIDTGFEESVPLIKASIRQLGFKYEDIRVLASSHAHGDHAGGLSLVKKETGARLHAMQQDAALLEAGGRGDFRFGDTRTFPPVTVDTVLRDGDVVELGGVRLLARHTPGHTKGATTFITIASERGRAHQVVFAASTMVHPGTPLVGNSGYPEIITDWQRTYAVLDSLTGDVWVTQHTSVFDIQGKLSRLGQNRNPYDDPAGYRRHVADSRQQFTSILAEQVASQR